jgi:hypothetical protein
VNAEYLMTDSTAGGVASGVALRWSGGIESSVRYAIAVRLNRANPGNIGVWLIGGTTPDVGSFTLLGLIPYTGQPSITLDVSLVGLSLSWDAVNNSTGVRATKIRPTDTVKADYGAATGVGFWMEGVGYAAIYCGEFRACPL